MSLLIPLIGNIETDHRFMIQVLDFLRDVKEKPEDHRITGRGLHQGSSRRIPYIRGMVGSPGQI